MQKHIHYIIRNTSAGDLLENFLISAIFTVVGVRLFLALTGYPQLGGKGLHIAHMLWGGALMTIAISQLLIFLNNESKKVASIIGGIGFGMFIDELGKFITSDNNYFFQPTISLIYIVFIIIFLLIRAGERYIKMTDKEYAINALDGIKEAVLYDLDSEEKQKALSLFEKSDKKNPVVVELISILKRAHTINPPKASVFIILKQKLSKIYFRLTRNNKFIKILISLFAISSIINLIFIFFVRFAILKAPEILTLSDYGEIITSIISSIFVFIGIFFLKKGNRLYAFEMYKYAIMISIFFTQIFIFYQNQLTALFTLSINILLYTTIRYVISQEQVLQKEKAKSIYEKVKGFFAFLIQKVRH